MDNPTENKQIKAPNFRSNGDTFCVRCQKCGLENYHPAVASGICSWCGEDHRKYK